MSDTPRNTSSQTNVAPPPLTWEMARRLAHDLRGALNLLNHPLWLLADESQADALSPTQRELVALATAGAATVARLTNDLLLALGTQAGELPLHVAPVALAGLLAEARAEALAEALPIPQAEGGADRRRAPLDVERAVRVEAPRSAVILVCDPALARRAVAALIARALVATQSAAHAQAEVVSVVAQRRRGQVVIAVRGAAQATAEEETAGEARDLGLAVAAAVARAHGGALTVEEPGGAQGMTVATLTLPLRPPAPAAQGDAQGG